MSLAARFDQQDHLVVGVLCNVPTVDQYHLVPFIQSRDTQVSLSRDAKKVSNSHVAFWKQFIPPVDTVKLLIYFYRLQSRNKITYRNHLSIHSSIKKTEIENSLSDLPGGPVVKNSSANAGDTGSVPGPGRWGS